MADNKTLTKGNVIVEDIKVGDVHFEFEYNCYIKSEVISLPKKNAEGNWVWQSKNLKSGSVIDYMVNPKYSHYAAKLYDYEAYSGCTQI